MTFKRIKSAPPAEGDFEGLEEAFSAGLTAQQVIEFFAARGEKLSEATFRKYVQLGLLPRSVRVARKGRGRGSQGLYPPTVVRQLARIRQLMANGFTIEEIQNEFLFIRRDIEALAGQLEQTLSAVQQAVARASDVHATDPGVTRALEESRALGEELVRKLEEIERRLSMRARMAKAAV